MIGQNKVIRRSGEKKSSAKTLRNKHSGMCVSSVSLVMQGPEGVCY